MRFKIDWASLVVGSKFTVFALLYFVFEGNFPSASPRGAYIWRGDLRDWSKSIGGGGSGPELLEMWLIKNTWPTPSPRHKND